jgi:hypothetical protein
MLDLFLRARGNRFFRARSASRDAETDFSRVEPVFRSIEQALEAAEAEHSGLDARVQDVLARASITLGNASDEYLTREAFATDLQNQFDREIANGQLRLEHLSHQIESLKFLKATLMTRFPDFNRRFGKTQNIQS